MSVVEAEIFINAPVEEVFALAMDPHRSREWVTIWRGVKDISGDPVKRGFRMKQQLCLRGVPFWVEWKLVGIDHPRFSRFEGKGPMRSKAVIENHLTPRDGGTLYRYRNEFHAPLGPLGAIGERVVGGDIPEREAQASLENLKRLAEERVAA